MINKQKLFSVCLILTMMAGRHAFGQEAPTPPAEPVSKKGYPILPKGGDFGLGFDAVPFLEYAGNLFSGSTSTNSVYSSFPNGGQQIYGKYFLGSADQPYESLMAIRGRFRVNNSSSFNRYNVAQDNLAIPDPSITVQDQLTYKQFGVEIGAGLEWRRGSGRLYGIYGGEVNFGYSTSSQEAEFGNAFSASNQTPTSTNLIGTLGGARGVAVNGQKTTRVGVRAFAGVEYFVAPRLSLSAEFSYGLNFSTTSKGSTDYQGWDSLKGATYTRTALTPSSGNSYLDTDNLGGSINLFFYF